MDYLRICSRRWICGCFFAQYMSGQVTLCQNSSSSSHLPRPFEKCARSSIFLSSIRLLKALCVDFCKSLAISLKSANWFLSYLTVNSKDVKINLSFKANSTLLNWPILCVPTEREGSLFCGSHALNSSAVFSTVSKLDYKTMISAITSYRSLDEECTL